MFARLQFILNIVATLFVFNAQSHAIVIAFDDFESYENGDLVGKNGGTGWAGAWGGDNSVSQIVDAPANLEFHISGGQTISGGTKSLRVNGNSDTAAFRQFSAAQDGDIYVSFLFYAEDGTDLGLNDFVSVWLGEGTYIGVPSMGLKSNLGPNGEDLMGRVTGTEEAYTAEMEIETTYYVVGRLTKENGSDTYNRYDLWVNPSVAEGSTPQAVSTGTIDTKPLVEWGSAQSTSVQVTAS